MLEIRAGAAPGELLVHDGHRVSRVFAVTAGATIWVFHEGVTYEVAANPAARVRAATAGGSLTAPMPATVVDVKVSPGDTVTRGDILIVLEAMKMELPVRAPGDGRVVAVHCQPGQLVQPETSLIEIAPLDAGASRAESEPGRGR